MRLIIFSDLDGTLLDHHTYDWSPAEDMIARLRQEGWPLVFVTSKTRAEVELLRADTGVDEPFVVENGAAVFFPARYDHLDLPGATRLGAFRVLVLGRPYEEVRGFAASVAHRFPMEAFGDMGIDRIRAVTGLSERGAELAARREFTEPFLLQDDDDLDRLATEAELAGFKITTGGRLHHLMGRGQDKGKAVRAVRDAFERAWGTRPITIALGDGPNDVPMLEAVDHAVLVPAPGRPLPRVSRSGLSIAPAEGPRGWQAALAALLRDLGDRPADRSGPEEGAS